MSLIKPGATGEKRSHSNAALAQALFRDQSTSKYPLLGVWLVFSCVCFFFLFLFFSPSSCFSVESIINLFVYSRGAVASRATLISEYEKQFQRKV